jgi:glycerol kinase
MTRQIVLAIDVGTTAIKVLAFEINSMACLGLVKKEISKKVEYDRVEQDPIEILNISIDLIRELVKKFELDINELVSIGIANQRETTILWNKNTGRPIYNAIVWEDSRTQEWCNKQSNEVHEYIEKNTGLNLSSYFSATKIKWILENVEGANEMVERGEILFGTVDTWILWNLSREASHLTDWTNASRTLLFDSKTKYWSDELLDIFNIPKCILPKILPSSSLFGHLRKNILGVEIPILAVIGDQQASMFAAQQYCGKETGCTKITFGTGVFLMQIVGDDNIIHDPFYKTLAVNTEASDVVWALEYKIENIGREVSELLNRHDELERYLDRLTDKISVIVKQLPIKPSEIIIDGGVTQNKYLHELLSEKIDSKIIELSTYNGTSLGAALLSIKNKLKN